MRSINSLSNRLPKMLIVISILSVLICSCKQVPTRTDIIKPNIQTNPIDPFPTLKREKDGTVKKSELELKFIEAAKSYESCVIELNSIEKQIEEFNCD